MKKLLSTLCFLIPCASLLAGISGTYNIKGFDPNIPGNYTGTVEITSNKESGVFHAVWTFNDVPDQDIGTGLKVGDELSFVFENPSTSGVQVYKIHNNSHLRGPWVNAGSDLVGREEITRVDNSSH